MRYKLIWIDDQYTDQTGFITEAEQEDIELITFKTSREGMAELENNWNLYDGVILDAKVYKNSEDETAKLDGLSNSIQIIHSLSSKRVIPYFIFTAHPDLLASETFNAMLNGKSSFLKNEDNDNLFREIKKAADNEPYTIIRNKYRKVFDICTAQYSLESVNKHLFDILFSIENQGEKFDDEKYFNGLRKVIEYVFRAANRIGILHDGCIPDGFVNLTWSSLFLAGREVELKPSTKRINSSKGYFPNILANNIKNILDITSSASHTESQENQQLKTSMLEYKNAISSNFLLYSLAFQIMDLVLWFKKCADENPSYAENIKRWRETTAEAVVEGWIKGTVFKIDLNNGFATFQNLIDKSTISIIPVMVKVNALKIGDIIEVRTKMDPTGNKLLIVELRKL
jgi:hypothetical protein